MIWHNVMATDDITLIRIAESICTEDSIRLSNDETKGILIFGTRYPNSMEGKKLHDEAWMVQYLIDNDAFWN